MIYQSRTRSLVFLFAGIGIVAATACGGSQTDATEQMTTDDDANVEMTTDEPTSMPATTQPTSMPTSQPTTMDSATTPTTPITARVLEAQMRLSSTEAGTLVWNAIEAQGGLQTWFENGPIQFRFNYQPLGDRPPTDTTQIIDTWSSLAVHTVTADPSIRFGWDGEQAWVTPADTELSPSARFWSLTPYYFVAMPFVLADPGVNLESEGQLELNGEAHDVVRVTFDDGTGDAPDDYYVVYFHAETHRVGGLRYVVSFPGFFPDGGHSPEKLMVYTGGVEVNGITLATGNPTYAWDGTEPGELVTEIEVTDVAFVETSDETFAMPEGATSDSGL